MRPQVVGVALAVRPQGDTDWVSIDPTSPTGRAFIERLGFTTPSKEDTMSAATIEQPTTRHLRVVENNRERMSLLLQTRQAARRAYDTMLSLPKSAWAWIKHTLHLDPALGFVADGFRWTKSKATTAMHYLGAPGMIGAGLLGISTDAGRAIIGTALKPVGWALRLFGRGWTWLENALHVDDPEKARLGGIRNAVSDRMADVRQFVVGEDTTGGNPGLVGKLATFIAKWVYPVFKYDSVPMQASRTAGTTILGMQMLPLVALLPLGGFAIAGQYLATAGVVTIAAGQGWGLISTVADWVKGKFAKAEDVATGEDHKGADAVDIVTVAAETGTVITHGQSTEPRAIRRAQGRPAKKAARR